MKRQFLLTLAVALLGGAAIAQPRSASEPELLIKADVGLMAPVWSPSGDKIAVTTDGYTGIFVADASGKNLKCVTSADGAGYKMKWSADGNQILGRTNITENNRVLHEVKVWNVNNATERTIVAKTRNLQGVPTWNNVGRVNIAQNNNIKSLSLNGATTTVAKASVYDMMTSDPVGVMTSIPALKAVGGKMVLNPTLSADGKKIAFQIYGKGMWMCNADGTDVKFIGTGVYPTWLPDGESVVFNRTTDDGSHLTSSELLAVNVNSGKTVSLVKKSNIIPLKPTVSPDGSKVAFENVADAAIYVVTLKY